MADLRILGGCLILHIVLQYIPYQVKIFDCSQPWVMVHLCVDNHVTSHQGVYASHGNEHIDEHTLERAAAHADQQKIGEQWYWQIGSSSHLGNSACLLL